MPYDLTDKLVLAISSRALFNLDEENTIFEEQGLDAYRDFQIAHEDEPLAPGTGFALVKALLRINGLLDADAVEVVLVSRNDADTGLRVMNSCEHYQLPISRAGFTDGRAPYPYLKPFSCDLFLSANQDDVQRALLAGFPAALAYEPPTRMIQDDTEVRIAFDGDAVLFSPDAEKVFREQGLEAFLDQERASAAEPMKAGPFKGFLSALHQIQRRFPEGKCPVRTALVTARNAPAHKRAINTLRTWNIRLDEAFFLGGVPKAGVLEVFRPHIFFDDQAANCAPSAKSLPTAQVPGQQIEIQESS